MNTNNFNEELITIEEIITDRYFKIPDYQRGYTWEEEHLKDLRKDIENISNKNHLHFTGTIVVTPIDKYKFEIVDGQQRLTSILILLKEIYNFDKIKYREIIETFIKRGKRGNEKFVLETNEETRIFFYNRIINDEENENPQLKSHQRLLDAKVFFKNWLEEENISVDTILNTVTKKLGFLVFSPNNDKELGIMFEVINNRGKELSELEKIKNYFIYYASIYDKSTLRDSINKRWVNIQKNLNIAGIVSNDDENRFLRNCYIVFYDSSKSKSWYVYNELKIIHSPYLTNEVEIENNVDKIYDFIKFLEQCSQFYSFLFNGGHFEITFQGEEKAAIGTVLKRLRCHSVNASILPLFLATMTRMDQPKNVAEILEIIEKVNFRVYILPKVTSRADSKQGDLFGWAYNFYHGSTSGDSNSKYGNKQIEGDIFQWIKLELIEFAKIHCNEKKFIQSLTIDLDEAEDYYYWSGIRFFLASYEEFLQLQDGHRFNIENILISRLDKGVENNDVLSLEHIWASNNLKIEFGEKHLEKRRLGNFVLMGLSKNIKLKDFSIEEKIRRMNETNLGFFKMKQIRNLEIFYNDSVKFVENTLNYLRKTKNYFRKLSSHINDQRETDMIRFALERWRLPGETFDRFEVVDSFREKQNLQETFFMN